MIEPFDIGIGTQFEIEKMKRAIDSSSDIEELRSLCKSVVSAWLHQVEATKWVMRQNTNHTFNFKQSE